MAAPSDREPLRFQEVQRFDQTWLKLVLFAVAGAALCVIIAGIYIQLIRGIPFGNNPVPDGALVLLNLVMFLLGVVLPLSVLHLKIEVRLDDKALSAVMWPLSRRMIPLEEIVAWEAKDYRPLRDFGGWGIRYSGKLGCWAYNVKGNRGVFLEMIGGKKVLIGSQRAEELAEAITEAKKI